MRRIGIDVGGTFTDIVLHDDATGKVRSTKVSSAPSGLSVGALNSLNRIVHQSNRARRASACVTKEQFPSRPNERVACVCEGNRSRGR
jgi:N-methylhydantoinase A/oxoprolinase/acetone carboxylase beta subunit